MMTPAREQLLLAACDGDPAAVDALLANLQPDLKRFARRSCASSEDAEDAVQIALWKVQRKLGTLRALPAMATWLFRIVERECFRLLRAMRLTGPLSPSLEDKLYSAPVPLQLRHDLVNAIASLPPEYRSVLILRDIDELTAPETAQQLGLSVAAVKTRLHRARGFMRERLMQGQYWSGADGGEE
ncbi:MAG: RNA polymerase sigma factor [Telluria sp.]